MGKLEKILASVFISGGVLGTGKGCLDYHKGTIEYNRAIENISLLDNIICQGSFPDEQSRASSMRPEYKELKAQGEYNLKKGACLIEGSSYILLSSLILMAFSGIKRNQTPLDKI